MAALILPARVPFYKSFKKPGQQLHLLRKDSHREETVHEVKDIFGKGLIDFAFIDGDHTYEGVKEDFEKYAPLVRQGGLVAFHDILPRPDLPEIAVDRFWEELKKKYKTEELIGDEGTGRRIGIGVVFMEKTLDVI